MPEQSPLEKFSDQVLIILTDYMRSDLTLADQGTRNSIAIRIIENAKLCRVMPNKYIGRHLAPAINETLEAYQRKKVFQEMGLIMEVKNEVVAHTKMVIAEHVPGGKGSPRAQQFKLFLGVDQGAHRIEENLNSWARGDEDGGAIPHIKRTQLAMATDTREGGSTMVGVLVSYEAP